MPRPKQPKRCIELHSGPDEHGRYSYSLHWWDDYFPGHPDGEHVRRERGQHFFGVPPQDLLAKAVKNA